MDPNSISYALAQIGGLGNYGLAAPTTYTPGLIAPAMNNSLNFVPQQGSSGLGLNPQAAGVGMNYGGQTALGGGGTNLNQGNGFGFNMPTLQMGLQGLMGLGNLYLGSKALGMAQDQFDFSKRMATTNLANQTKAYNTALEDRLRTREQFNTGESSGAWKSDFERLKATT